MSTPNPFSQGAANQIANALQAQSLQNGFTQSIFNAWLAGIDSLKQTTAEIAAGVTPVNYAYAPYNAWRYGADPTGNTDSTAALNLWLQVVQTVTSSSYAGQAFQGGYLPGGVYLISGPLLPITTSKVRIYGDGSDVSRIVVNGVASSFIVLQIGNTLPTSTVIDNIQVEGIGILRNSGSAGMTLMAVYNTQYSHYRDLTLYDNTGVTGGCSLDYRGHENNTFENLWLTNIQPIIMGNPSGTADDGCDHTAWIGLEMQSNSNTQPLISVIGVGTSISNQTFIGNQVWLGGNYGFYWNDTSAGTGTGVGGNLEFNNIRREQTSGTSANQTIYINVATSNSVSNVSVRDSTFGLPTTLSGGLYFSGVNWVTLENVNLSVGGVGVTMIGRAGQSSTQLVTINCNLDPTATVLTNMEQVFGSNDAILGLDGSTPYQPQTCVYQYTDANNQTVRGMRIYEARKWSGSRQAVAASGGIFIIPGSATSVAMVTVVAYSSGVLDRGDFACAGETVVMSNGTANMAAAITSGKISVTWASGSSSYVVTNDATAAKNINVSVEWM
jgi:hypothetical protein